MQLNVTRSHVKGAAFGFVAALLLATFMPDEAYGTLLGLVAILVTAYTFHAIFFRHPNEEVERKGI